MHFLFYITYWQFENLTEINGLNLVVYKVKHRHGNNGSSSTLFSCTLLKRKVTKKVGWMEKFGKRMQTKLIPLLMSFFPIKWLLIGTNFDHQDYSNVTIY